MTVNPVALGSIAAGCLFAYAGIKGYSIPQTLQDVITGKTPTGQAQTTPVGTPQGEIQATVGDTGIDTGPGSPGGGSDTENQTLGKFMAAAYGWTGQQWTDLNAVVMKESGWNNQIYNGGTIGGPYQPNKAYGIAQALGHGNNGAPYPTGNMGNPPGAGGTSSAYAQIAWMLKYIQDAYGNPAGALASENTRGWY